MVARELSEEFPALFLGHGSGFFYGCVSPEVVVLVVLLEPNPVFTHGVGHVPHARCGVSSRRLLASGVLRVCCESQVTDLHAGPVPARVVQLHSVWDWSVDSLPGVSVGADPPPSHAERSITAWVNRPSPDQAFPVPPGSLIE